MSDFFYKESGSLKIKSSSKAYSSCVADNQAQCVIGAGKARAAKK